MATKANVKDIKALMDRFDEIDPLGAIVVASAGIAGACGVRGPLTTLVGGISDTLGGKGTSTPATIGIEAVFITPLAVFEGLNYLSRSFSGEATTSTLPASDAERLAMITAIGNAAGNMVEAGIMYQLVKNPETMRFLFDAGKEAVKGAAGLGKLGGLVGAI